MPQLDSGIDSGPLLIFDKYGSVLVISSLNSIMAASCEHDVDKSSVSWGIMGKVDAVPKDFQYSTIMYYSSSGINKVLYCFGYITLSTLFCQKSADKASVN